MEERNLDLQVPVSREQWGELGRTAQRIHSLGYDWSGDEPDRIRVSLRDEEARGLWTRLVSDEGKYGESEREIAQFVFNDGRPFAHLEAPVTLDEPQIQPQQEAALEEGQARFVREKWQVLLERAGIHFTPGHVPTDVE